MDTATAVGKSTKVSHLWIKGASEREISGRTSRDGAHVVPWIDDRNSEMQYLPDLWARERQHVGATFVQFPVWLCPSRMAIRKLNRRIAYDTVFKSNQLSRKATQSGAWSRRRGSGPHPAPTVDSLVWTYGGRPFDQRAAGAHECCTRRCTGQGDSV